MMRRRAQPLLHARRQRCAVYIGYASASHAQARKHAHYRAMLPPRACLYATRTFVMLPYTVMRRRHNGASLLLLRTPSMHCLRAERPSASQPRYARYVIFAVTDAGGGGRVPRFSVVSAR